MYLTSITSTPSCVVCRTCCRSWLKHVRPTSSRLLYKLSLTSLSISLHVSSSTKIRASTLPDKVPAAKTVARNFFLPPSIIFLPRVGPGHPFPPCPSTSSSFSPFYFSFSFIGFTYFLLLSILSLSTRIDPLCFLAGCRRRRLNQGLVVALGFFLVVR